MHTLKARSGACAVASTSALAHAVARAPSLSPDTSDTPTRSRTPAPLYMPAPVRELAPTHTHARPCRLPHGARSQASARARSRPAASPRLRTRVASCVVDVCARAREFVRSRTCMWARDRVTVLRPAPCASACSRGRVCTCACASPNVRALARASPRAPTLVRSRDHADAQLCWACVLAAPVELPMAASGYNYNEGAMVLSVQYQYLIVGFLMVCAAIYNIRVSVKAKVYKLHTRNKLEDEDGPTARPYGSISGTSSGKKDMI
eukprot:6185768-Pleurochrysis_carterae.AAC.3